MFNQIKKYLFVSLFILLNCQSVRYHYHGKVTDENNVPLKDVFVTLEYFENNTKTDKKGYFKLKRCSNSLGNLIFNKEGYKTDTIPTVWSQHGEALQYNFIEKDTTVIRLKGLIE